MEQAKLSATLTVMQQVLGELAPMPLLRRASCWRELAARAEDSWPAQHWATRPPAPNSWPAAKRQSRPPRTAPLLVPARLLEPRLRQLRRWYASSGVVAVEREAYAKIARAIFAVRGDDAYPDGTFTLRLL